MGLQLRVTTLLTPLCRRKINDGGAGLLNCIGLYFYLRIKRHVIYGKWPRHLYFFNLLKQIAIYDCIYMFNNYSQMIMNMFDLDCMRNIYNSHLCSCKSSPQPDREDFLP